ncbi:hypothetical protein E0I74_23125 [Rhizobium laguerreae]|uniref:hypothetical protein n=1 Tax=Rhizobium laguerreae TaxID=1076926 RepID=UPI00103AAD68|nr:hypothetical protein [Rhizobium laguerreae]MBN9985073.1 hypothetical protein [Rhizobium laguerreae]MBY3074475.1 hypothetical protein [Rhizobium laguerreae]MBY3095011.1 hypothetical protein [Rhizobium laguerreae]MBY3100713.1 hypothetical protein [Rhizobium laguerreae]MBY3107303.1 hypothetical protein [Rhizobium laguerreae]
MALNGNQGIDAVHDRHVISARFSTADISFAGSSLDLLRICDSLRQIPHAAAQLCDSDELFLASNRRVQTLV